MNIDRFFASGPESTPPADAGLAQKKKEKSIVPQSLTKKKAAPNKKMTKLSQLMSKGKYSQAEADIAGGITDDTATAAAEQALMEAANTMTEQQHDEIPPAQTADYDGSDDAAAQTADESTDRQVEEAAAALAAAQEAIARETKDRPVSKEMQAEIDNAQETLAAEAKKLFAAKLNPQAAA